MKLLLLNPRHPQITVDRPALGLAYIASSVERACETKVRILDLTVHPLTVDQIIRTVKEFAPQIIGISVLSCTFETSISLAHSIKKEYPNALLVAGGPHPTACPEDTLSGSSFDIAVVGEGEHAMVDIVKAYPNITTCIPGIYIKSGNGQVCPACPRPRIRDLDSLPYPARNLLPLDKYDYAILGRTATPICSSRGCPMKCIYCDQSVFGETFRARTAENVLGEISHICEELGYSAFDFIDDTFTLEAKRVEAICKGIRERGYDVYWRCLGRVDNVTPELLESMRDAGCIQIYYGIESGSESTLQMMGKNITVEQIRRAVRWTKKADIKAKGFFIIGLPWETHDDILKTVELAEELKLDGGKFALPKPFPNTRLLANLQKEHKMLKDATSQLAYYLSDHEQIFIYENLTHDEALELLKQARERLGRLWSG